MQIIVGIVKDTVSIYLGEKGDKIGKLVRGDTIQASENDSQWLHLSFINNIDVSTRNWWTTAGGTGQYIDWHWETVDDGDGDNDPQITSNPAYIYIEDPNGIRNKYIREDLI